MTASSAAGARTAPGQWRQASGPQGRVARGLSRNRRHAPIGSRQDGRRDHLDQAAPPQVLRARGRLDHAFRRRSTTRCAEDVEGAIGPRSGFIPLFTAALAPWPAPAPHLLAHQDKNEHDSNRQENSVAPPRCRRRPCHEPTLTKSASRPPTGALPGCYRERGGVASSSTRR